MGPDVGMPTVFPPGSLNKKPQQYEAQAQDQCEGGIIVNYWYTVYRVQSVRTNEPVCNLCANSGICAQSVRKISLVRKIALHKQKLTDVVQQSKHVFARASRFRPSA